jgi:hypothetical protein
MKKLFAALAVMLSMAGTAHADIIRFITSFSPEAVGATGTGSAGFYFDTTTNELTMSFGWTGLSAPTTVAHIHCCVPAADTGTIGVALTPGTLPGFPTGVTEGTYQGVFDLDVASNFTGGFITRSGGTVAGAAAALIAGMTNGTAYLNIHTTRFPGGEIRGFIRVSTPESLSLAALGLGLLAFVGRRRA